MSTQRHIQEIPVSTEHGQDSRQSSALTFPKRTLLLLAALLIASVMIWQAVAAGVSRTKEKGYLKAVPLGALGALLATIAT